MRINCSFCFQQDEPQSKYYSGQKKQNKGRFTNFSIARKILIPEILLKNSKWIISFLPVCWSIDWWKSKKITIMRIKLKIGRQVFFSIDSTVIWFFRLIDLMITSIVCNKHLIFKKSQVIDSTEVDKKVALNRNWTAQTSRNCIPNRKQYEFLKKRWLFSIFRLSDSKLYA